ncbi:MAG: hypothetical protein KAG92_05140 [Deltaproteobacteria bacterium]|nr:hypothetical protein [Deltaproteobacteria bacterium]
MFRFILWIGLGYLFFRLFRGRPATPEAPVNRRESGSGEKMVKCLRCGLYVPEHEALAGGRRNPGGYFCSRECQQKKPD